MTYFRQPWGRLTVTGRRCRLQVLDPATAFELEPQLIENFGEHLVMLLAARGNVYGQLWNGVLADHGFTGSLSEVAKSGEQGLEIATDALRRTVAMLTQCAQEARLDGRWLAEVFERMAFDRLRVDDLLIEDWTTWRESGLGPLARWQVLAAQIEQTYQPLWLRAPYSVRGPAGKDYGVKPPPGVSAVSQWANNLAMMGSTSAQEIFANWTPVQLMDAVDSAAYKAEIDRKAMDAAKTANG